MTCRDRARRLARVERLRAQVLDAAQRAHGVATQRESLAERAQSEAEAVLWSHTVAVAEAVAAPGATMPAQAASHVGHLLRQHFARNVEACTRDAADARRARAEAADVVRAAYREVAPVQKLVSRYHERARLEEAQRTQHALDEFATQRAARRPTLTSPPP